MPTWVDQPTTKSCSKNLYQKRKRYLRLNSRLVKINTPLYWSKSKERQNSKDLILRSILKKPLRQRRRTLQRTRSQAKSLTNPSLPSTVLPNRSWTKSSKTVSTLTRKTCSATRSTSPSNRRATKKTIHHRPKTKTTPKKSTTSTKLNSIQSI